jgi:enoyl-CoA hydratase/carnithine racemase
MMDALDYAIGELENDHPRALLIRAAGRVVSGGVDVGKTFDGVSPEQAEALWSEWLTVIQRLEAMPCPTIFAAHALCLTAAFEVALACDLLVAANSAKFGLVETVVGLTPSMGGPQRLVARAGPARAKELILTGEIFDAATLERWNVVNRVLPDEGFDDHARAFAQRLADGPTLAHAATKAIVAETVAAGVPAADGATPGLSAALFETSDLQDAVQSFISEGPGKATFSGR